MEFMEVCYLLCLTLADQEDRIVKWLYCFIVDLKNNTAIVQYRNFNYLKISCWFHLRESNYENIKPTTTYKIFKNVYS